jgi:hypothetical protein
MKVRNLGILLLLSMMFGAAVSGCYPYHRGVGVDVTVHDNRWHYDHDYDDGWRANHPWHSDRNDWDH